MQCQIYLQGRLYNNPEVGATKKGSLLVKIVLECRLTREIRPGEAANEDTRLPIICFGSVAERVKGLREGDTLTLGVHVQGTEWQPTDGPIKRGIQFIADAVFLEK